MPTPNDSTTHPLDALAHLDGDWGEYRIHVIEEMKRLSGEVAALRGDITSLRMWAAAAGAASAAVTNLAFLVYYFIKKV